MHSIEVAKLLNLELIEFQKVEASIASVLRLKKDENGKYLYRNDHVESLQEVFSDLEGRALGQKSQKEEPPSIDRLDNGNLKSLPLGPRTTMVPSMEAVTPKGEEDKEPEERKIRSAIPFFERIKKEDDEEGAGMAKTEALEVSSLVKMIQDQRNYFENRIREIEQGDLKVLREENLQLKKDLLIQRKEKETLQNIIRNQNEDKRYLIEKLNQKFSLRNALQWKTAGPKAFEGNEQLSKGRY